MTQLGKPVFPIALVLEGRACLVVGSGPELTSRTHALLDAHARPVVVSSTPSDEIRALARDGRIELRERDFVDADLNGTWLAVLVDQNPALAAHIAHLAEAERVFFCAVDQPEHNSYAHMAQARAGLLTIAISTAGQAPALGRRLREELERLLEQAEMTAFVARLAELRARTPSADRRRVLGAAVSGVHFSGELELGKR
ncbi:MAG TPA: NAD(P)-dependent oxidoreductase [Polyangiaceae bacterium]|jgi:precorrin-2 dehydrogenase/sirohydrochlorin ferrochelatase|nr:NAD(P)-dependent oxidoreductase [Polyangiaceae bacterium]